MVKIWCLILPVLLGLHACGLGDPLDVAASLPPPEPEPEPVPEVCSPLAVAMTQVGVKEATGKNDGVEVEAYLASTGLGKGHPWCAAFCHYAYRGCDTILTPKHLFARAAHWNRPENRVWQRGGWKYEREWTRISQDGDLFGLFYNNLNRVGHVGFIHNEDEKYLLTVEGNTGSGGEREGDGVYLRTRLKSSVYCVSRWPLSSPR